MKMRKNKIILSAICVAFLLTSSLTAFASSPQIGSFSTKELSEYGEQEVLFLLENGVNDQEIRQLDVDTVQSLNRQAEANQFTSDQIQAYVSGQLNYVEPRALEGVLSKDGTYYTYADGTTLPNLQSRYNLIPGEQLSESVSTRSFTGSPQDVIDGHDQSGVYWVVKSETGYNEATAFADLPTLSNIASKDRPYMFLAANSFAQGNSLTIIGDFGVVYVPSTGKWRPFVNLKQWSNTQRDYVTIDNSVYNTNITSSKVYLHLLVTKVNNTTSTVRIRILNGTNFNTVYLDKTYTVAGNPVQANYTNLNIFRETTMAQVLTGTTLDANTNSKMTSAKYSQSYLYKPGVTALWGTTQTNKVYRQAPTKNKLGCVTINSTGNTPWHTDNITIHFNKT